MRRITIKRARIWHYRKMRPCIGPSNDLAPLSPFRSWRGCIPIRPDMIFGKDRSKPSGVRANVRFGSLADIASRPRHVRYSPQSRHSSARFARPAIGQCERLPLLRRSASALSVGTIDCVTRTPDASFQPISNFLQSSTRAGVIQLGSWSAARANCTNGFVAELDDNSAPKKHHMRELGQWRDLTSPALL